MSDELGRLAAHGWVAPDTSADGVRYVASIGVTRAPPVLTTPRRRMPTPRLLRTEFESEVLVTAAGLARERRLTADEAQPAIGFDGE
jgi:hypothetical protein